MRYLQADQFLGTLFKISIKSRKNDGRIISWEVFMKLSRDIDMAIRRKNKAMLYMTKEDIFIVLNSYQYFFQADEKFIKINSKSKEDSNSDIEDNTRYIDFLQSNFIDGIPKDILNTVTKECVKKLVKVKQRC